LSDLYPVMLNLEGRACVVVGGGQVAARKVAGLLAAGAAVTVISPAICPEIEEMVDFITIHLQPYTPGMLAAIRPLLVFAATDVVEVNRHVALEARELGALVDTVDSGDDGDFSSMAVFRRGRITVAISTNGASPVLAAHLRDQLADVIGDEYAILADWMADARARIRDRIPEQANRAALWQRVLDSPIPDLLHGGDERAARALFYELLGDES